MAKLKQYLQTFRRRSLRLGRNRNASPRSGVAIVEFSVTLPILVLIVLGTIEATSMIFLEQSLEIAAYEGARVAIVPNTEAVNCVLASQRILDARGVDGANVTVSPANFPSQPYGTPITVTVTASCAANALFAPMFYSGRNATAEVTMMKECD